MNILSAFISILAFPVSGADIADSITLQSVDIVSSIKSPYNENGSYSSTTIERKKLEQRHIVSIKELSAVAPNFYQPDYGSRMTSSIYVRGFGSRMDQPVVGLNIDDAPVMNKNNYDFDLFDISHVQIMRGAQSTLYGRNTAGGTINVHTLSPMYFQGKRLSVEYGNENSLRIKASHYARPSHNFGWSASAYYSHCDGFFTNKERGEKCDGGDNAAIRLRMQWLPSEGWSIDNALTTGYTDEGGYAYRAYDSEKGTLSPVAYNDPCSYRRFNASDRLTIKHSSDKFTFSSVTGYQYTNDRMRIDNDFLPLEYFSMGQYQKEHALTQEFTIKSNDEKALKWLGGIFAFGKHLDMDAPVLFKHHGIEYLIEENANKYFFHENGYDLDILEESFPIEDRFKIPTYGTAVYGQMEYSMGCFVFSAGLRLDYEHSYMDYDCDAEINYKYQPDSNEYRHIKSRFKGSVSLHETELLPRLSVTWKHKAGSVYASFSKGFKAGGFNTQLFSDILQKKLTDDIIGNRNNDDASSVIYHPEESRNYELGAHLSPLADKRLNISVALFFIDCRNQQLTVFPKGLSTGRMMSNAGKSHSYGVEASASYTTGNCTLNASYGYTRAVFDEYISGNDDYSGNVLPFAPRETMSANLSYKIPVSREFANRFILNVGWNGIGRIYWNESNTLSQAFYGTVSASLFWEKGIWGCSVWGKNLLNEEYNCFYFKSIGNNFFAQGKPLQAGISLHLNL